jgi:hypothetical protein
MFVLALSTPFPIGDSGRADEIDADQRALLTRFFPNASQAATGPSP